MSKVNYILFTTIYGNIFLQHVLLKKTLEIRCGHRGVYTCTCWVELRQEQQQQQVC